MARDATGFLGMLPHVIRANFDAIPITRNYILQLHKIMYGHMDNPSAFIRSMTATAE